MVPTPTKVVLKYCTMEYGEQCVSMVWAFKVPELYICRQLGFPAALAVLNTYDPGSGPTLLRYTDCFGEEEGIQFCQHPGWHSGDSCRFSFRDGVECAGMFVV